MGTNQDYKNRALASLKGKWRKVIVATVITWAIAFGIASIGVFMHFFTGLEERSDAIAWVLTLPLYWGFSVYFLNLAREDNIAFSRLFDGYKNVCIFLTMIVCGSLIYISIYSLAYIYEKTNISTYIICICTLLLIVLSIIITILLSQMNYILKDYDVDILVAMKKSFDMMKGHIIRYIWLCLSFIGWWILAIAIITCCIIGSIGFLALILYWGGGWWILAIITCCIIDSIGCIVFFALISYWNTTMAHYYEDLKAEYEQLNNVETESPLD